MLRISGRSLNFERENALMAARWRKFDLFKQIPILEQKTAPTCARCFAELVMMGGVL